MGSSYAQQITPEGGAKVFTGSNVRDVLDSGATSIQVGTGATLSTAPTVTSNTGTVNIGEQGTTQTFAETIKALFNTQAEQTTGLLAALSPNVTTAPPPAAAATEESAPGESWFSKLTDKTKYTIAAVAVLLVGWRFLKRK